MKPTLLGPGLSKGKVGFTHPSCCLGLVFGKSSRQTEPMIHPGIVIALLSALLFGASTPLAKVLLASIDPWLLAGLLYLGAGIGLAALRLCQSALGKSRAEARLQRRDLPWLALVVLAGGIAGPLFLMFGLTRTDAASASLLLNLEGLATMLIAWTVFRENADRRLLIGALAVLAGAVVLSWQGAATLDLGAGLIALACLCWGIDNNLTRKLAAADPIQIAMIKGLGAGLVNLSIALALGSDMPATMTVLTSGAIGFLGYGVSLTLFILALRHLGAARTGAYFAAAPFVGAGLAVVLLAEPVSAQLVGGAVLMAAGLWLHLTENHEHGHSHAAVAHDHRHSHDTHHQHVHGPDTPGAAPHSHWHHHAPLTHRHPHYPDLHHRHTH